MTHEITNTLDWITSMQRVLPHITLVVLTQKLLWGKKTV